MTLPRPGWHPDPQAPGVLRWWDGRSWTGHVAASSSHTGPPASDSSMRWVLPVGRSGLAVAAGYLGLCAAILIPAPVAIIVSVLALVDLRRHPQKLGRGRAWFGLIMGLAFTVLLALAIAKGGS